MKVQSREFIQDKAVKPFGSYLLLYKFR